MNAATVTNLPVAQPQDDASGIMEAVLLAGDLSKLTADERTSYYMRTCSSLGLNPYTKPFDYIRLSGREVLYATKGCADQLRSNRRISLEITDRRVTGDMMTVTVRATTPDGRSDEDMAAIFIKGLVGEALANAAMKVTTKAKRRVTLSICGLGMLDETEVRSALEAERLAEHPADIPPKKSPQPAIEAAIEAPKPKPPLEVVIGDGWEPAKFPRTRPGLEEALEFITGAVVDGRPGVVALNNALLDTIAERMPELADRISRLRAEAIEALMPKDEPEPVIGIDYDDGGDPDMDLPPKP